MPRLIWAAATALATALMMALPAAASDSTSTLTLSVSHAKVPYRTTVTVTAHLATAAENPLVSIYRVPAGGAPVLVASGSVDAGGDLTATVTLTRNSTFSAHWDGDTANAPADSAARAVRVHVAIAGAFVSSPYKRDGSVRLFHFHPSCPSAASGCVVWSAKVRPTHAGDAVTFVLQRRTSTGWHAVSKLSQQLGSDSTARVRFRYTRAAVGVPLRFVARFGGDASNLGGSTPFAPFRITN